MSSLQQSFERARTQGRAAVVPYMTAGHPDLEATYELIVELATSGVVAIEVGVPFSDPMADGPVIQRACERALEKGVTLKSVLETVKRATATAPEANVVLFSYLNPLLQYGLDRLAVDARNAGVAGVLVTDLPSEIAAPFATVLGENGIDLISLVAPTTTDARLAEIAAHSSGFIYAVSRTGVTGTQQRISDDAFAIVDRVRRVTSLPVALGFGISNSEQVHTATQHADAAVVGSALVQLIESTDRQQLIPAVRNFMSELTRPQSAVASMEK